MWGLFWRSQINLKRKIGDGNKALLFENETKHESKTFASTSTSFIIFQVISTTRATVICIEVLKRVNFSFSNFFSNWSFIVFCFFFFLHSLFHFECVKKRNETEIGNSFGKYPFRYWKECFKKNGLSLNHSRMVLYSFICYLCFCLHFS